MPIETFYFCFPPISLSLSLELLLFLFVQRTSRDPMFSVYFGHTAGPQCPYSKMHAISRAEPTTARVISNQGGLESGCTRANALSQVQIQGPEDKKHQVQNHLVHILHPGPESNERTNSAKGQVCRWADYYGCLPGHDVQMADAIQAHIQAKLSGVPCWVELPDEAWHPSANRHKYRRPVCRLVKGNVRAS